MRAVLYWHPDDLKAAIAAVPTHIRYALLRQAGNVFSAVEDGNIAELEKTPVIDVQLAIIDDILWSCWLSLHDRDDEMHSTAECTIVPGFAPSLREHAQLHNVSMASVLSEFTAGYAAGWSAEKEWSAEKGWFVEKAPDGSSAFLAGWSCGHSRNNWSE